jgi:TonB family protein
MAITLRGVAFATLTMLAIIPPTVAPAEILHPIQNWVVDYREEQCVAYRDYGSPAKPITLGVRPAPNGETYELMIARPRSGPELATEQQGSVDFGRGPIKAWILNYGGKQSKTDIYQFRISAAGMEQARSAKAVTLRPASTPAFSFELQSMPALLKGLEDCTTDLKRYWNMDGEKVGRIATLSRGDIRSLFSADDYPQEALERNQGGESTFLLLVDEKGAVAECHVLKPSGVPVLDAMGCQVIRERAKFTPARDAQGKAVRSTLVTPSVSWRIE